MMRDASMAGLVPAIAFLNARAHGRGTDPVKRGVGLTRRQAHASLSGLVTMLSSPDTIFAVASGFGRAAVAVVRISGPQTRSVLEMIAGAVPAQPRRMV